MIHFSYPVVSFAALALFLGVFLPVTVFAQTQQQCQDESEEVYANCFLNNSGSVQDCEEERDRFLSNCAVKLELNSDKGKVGCYCIVEPQNANLELGISTDNNESQETVRSFPDKNTREKCGGNESLPNGDQIISCKWYEPAPGKKIIPLPSGISSLNNLLVA